MKGLKLNLALVFCVFLSSCTGVNPVPPANLSSLLTPTSQDALPAEAEALTAELDANSSDTTGEGDVSDSTEVAVSSDSTTAESDATIVETADASASGVASETDQQVAAVSEEGSADSLDTSTTAAVEPAAEATQTALAATPPQPANPFAAFLKSQSGATRPRSNVGDDRPGSRSTFRKPAKKQQVARLTVNRTASSSANRASGGALPGVKMKNIFAIDEEENEDGNEEIGSDATRLAAITNMARRGTHGLLLQRDDVKVGCFPPGLLSILKKVERRFGRTPVVTSGYRSAAYNRKIRGAKKSLHVRCLAADIQVVGVSKWTLAKYLRSLPGRGGVGTYCHTASVHIDIGTKRDWNRRCRRKRNA